MNWFVLTDYSYNIIDVCSQVKSAYTRCRYAILERCIIADRATIANQTCGGAAIKEKKGE